MEDSTKRIENFFPDLRKAIYEAEQNLTEQYEEVSVLAHQSVISFFHLLQDVPNTTQINE